MAILCHIGDFPGRWRDEKDMAGDGAPSIELFRLRVRLARAICSQASVSLSNHSLDTEYIGAPELTAAAIYSGSRFDTARQTRQENSR